jgi:ABC-2 type transport system permease protein
MNNRVTVAHNFVSSSLKSRILLIMLGLFLFISILSVYVGTSTLRAELRAYQEACAMIRSGGSAIIPDPPVITPLSTMKNSIDYVLMVGALLALFMGFDVISREQENRTLSLILTRPLYRDELLRGKVLGAVFLLCGLNLAALILESLFLYGIGTAGLSFTVILRLLLFHTAASFYMLLFFLAAMFFSILFLRSETSFLASVIFWVGSTYVLPELAASVRNYTLTSDAASSSIQSTAMDTPTSLFIDFLSPAVHFKHIGEYLFGTGNPVNGTSLLGGMVFLLGLEVFFLLESNRYFNKREVLTNE